MLVTTSSKQIKYGAILSYVLLAASAIYGLFVTSFILRYVDNDVYGVYKSVSSLSGTLAIIDFGLGATMTRYIARYNATGEKEKANNFIAMIFLEFIAIIVLLIGIGVVFLFNIKSIYSETFNQTQINLASSLFSILLINMGMTLFENLFFGISNGNEKFIFSNGVKLCSLLIRFLLIVILLPITRNVFVVVLADTVILGLSLFVFVFYSFLHLKIRPKLRYWDKQLFRESFFYTFLIFVQTLVIQFSGNVDNVIIGAKISAVAVTVYSMALIIYNMYQNLSGSIANLMLPKITKCVVNGASSEELQEEVVKFGRYQFFLLAAALGGLICLGQDFFELWLGSGFNDCYLLSIILVTSVTLPTIGNVAISILRAQNRMIFRTIVVVSSCVVNVLVTLIGIEFWGYWGAAIGTALSSIVNFICMNIYYHFRLKFKVAKMFFDITFKTILCAYLPTLFILFLKSFFSNSVLSFLLLGLLFVAMYVVLLFFFSMNNEEKNSVFLFFKKKTKST